MGAGFYRRGSARGRIATKRAIGAPSRSVACAESLPARGSTKLEAEPAQFVAGKKGWAEKQIARPVIGVARSNVPIMEIGHPSVKKNLRSRAIALSEIS
jgi:hypothetical protein